MTQGRKGGRAGELVALAMGEMATVGAPKAMVRGPVVEEVGKDEAAVPAMGVGVEESLEA